MKTRIVIEDKSVCLSLIGESEMEDRILESMKDKAVTTSVIAGAAPAHATLLIERQ